jgi:sensor histidine kinase regulating citrate/malate metabolism
MPGRWSPARRWGLARQLLVLQSGVIAATVAIGAVVSVVTAHTDATASNSAQVLAIGETLASSPGVVGALESADPSAVLEPQAAAVQARTGTSFIVFMSPTGMRYTHPNTALIGQHFIGDITPAQHGRSFTETYTGTLGKSVRSVVPITDHGRVIGLVSVGLLVERISAEASRQLPSLFAWAALALAVGTAGSLLLASRIRRQTLGLEPAEIARQYQHHDAMLHAVREGLLITDRTGRLVLANDEAHRLVGLSRDGAGQVLADVLSDPALAPVLGDREPVSDQVCVAEDRVLLVSRSPARLADRPIGVVTTLRDRTELRNALRELDTVRALADSLRAQAHESANRIQALVGLVELGRHDEAIELGTRATSVAQRLSDQLMERVGEPALVALLLGKSAVAGERGVELRLTEDTALASADQLPIEALLTVVGNLLDNAVDAVTGQGSGWVELTLREQPDGGLLVRVADSGPGIAAEHVTNVFTPGWTTKPSSAPGGRGIGLALVRQIVDRLGGTISVTTVDGAVFEVRLPANEMARPS